VPRSKKIADVEINHEAAESSRWKNFVPACRSANSDDKAGTGGIKYRKHMSESTQRRASALDMV
jgi:ligand-binding sensor protein